HGVLVRIAEPGVPAREHRRDDLVAEPGGLAGLDMRLAYVVGVPVLRDHQDSDLDLAGRERAALVEMGPDVLHPVRNRRRMDPHLVGAEDATAPGGEPVEHGLLLGGELFGRNLEDAVHGGASVGWSRHPTRALRFLRRFDRLLLDHDKAERQRAGAYAGREIACLLDREIAGDLARAAEDGLADDGG